MILPILDDDGFDFVPEKEARPGDIVVYWGELGDVVHSGFVVRREKAQIGTASMSIPIVWSKWGKGYEMIHPVGECPYLESGNSVTYYRLKRWKPTTQPAASGPTLS